MSVVSPEQLKAYFQTGLVPSQGNFADLIDSSFSRFQGLSFAGSLNQVLQGTVSTTAGSPSVTGLGTRFTSQLWPGAAMQIAGQVYSVDGISSDTLLSLKQTVVAASSNVTAITEGTLLSISSQQGALLATLTPSGCLGLGTGAPTHAIEVVGTVKATGFEGSGAALTGIQVSNITGVLAPSQVPDLTPRTVLFYTSTPCVQAGASVTLNWVADPGYALMLSHVSDAGIVNTAVSVTAPTCAGSCAVTVSQTTVFTLTASVNGGVVAQHQLQVCVVPAPAQTPLAYVNALKAKNVPLPSIIQQCAAKFDYDTLSVANIGLLAGVLKAAGFQNKDIYDQLPHYYGFNAADASAIPYMRAMFAATGGA